MILTATDRIDAVCSESWDVGYRFDRATRVLGPGLLRNCVWCVFVFLTLRRLRIRCQSSSGNRGSQFHAKTDHPLRPIQRSNHVEDFLLGFSSSLKAMKTVLSLLSDMVSGFSRGSFKRAGRCCRAR